MDLLETLAARARSARPRIVLPEGDDERIRRAASLAAEQGVARPVLLGDVDVPGVEVIPVDAVPGVDAWAEDLAKARGLPVGAARRILAHPVFLGAAMVRHGAADALVAGIRHETRDVVLAADMLLEPVAGEHPSTAFLIRVPGWRGSEGEYVLLADCATNPDPTADELAGIALATAHTAVALLGWEPRVAMLSFSTHGSADHERVARVALAVRQVREREPALRIDGDLQADAAIDAEVARIKLADPGPVAGRANVLVFPSLEASNIAYKLIQRMTGAQAWGPILQGYRHRASDLSRGASILDVVGTLVLVGAAATG